MAAPVHGGFGGNLDEDCVGRGFVDHDWIAFGQREGRSGCFAGAAAPELGACAVAFSRLVSCVRRVASSVRFFGPVFLINRTIVQFV